LEKNNGQSTTLAQKINAVAYGSMFIATPIIILIRKKPGYRFLNPIGILIMFAALLALASFGYVSGGTGATVVTGLFALATLILGLVKRRLRWNDIKRGISWHSYSRGVSWLTDVLPYSDTTIKRWFDPLAVLLVGILLAFIFLWFGLYLILSAFCLFLFEAWDYEQSLNAMLDVLDAQIDAEVTSSNVEYYTASEHPQQRPLEETAGIPTGIAPDIEAQIQKRNRRQQAAPDNLATGMA
jgi:hypothetical protein